MYNGWQQRAMCSRCSFSCWPSRRASSRSHPSVSTSRRPSTSSWKRRCSSTPGKPANTILPTIVVRLRFRLEHRPTFLLQRLGSAADLGCDLMPYGQKRWIKRPRLLLKPGEEGAAQLMVLPRQVPARDVGLRLAGGIGASQARAIAQARHFEPSIIGWRPLPNYPIENPGNIGEPGQSIQPPKRNGLALGVALLAVLLLARV